MSYIKGWWAFLMLTVLLAGCSSPQETGKLRIAVLPILDTLPLFVAEAEGNFAEQGIEVEFITAASAAERDQLLQAGQVDGIITDLVALALYNRAEISVVAVRYAMVPTLDFPQFRVMASAQSGITSAAGLRGILIGVSEGTVIEYVTTRLLEAEGLASSEITTIAVPKIPDRMALLNAGELDAATLPEPLGSLAMQQGAFVIVDDAHYPEISCSLFAFRKAVLDTQPKTVRGFLNAVDRAGAIINADKGRWVDLLTEKSLVPPSLVGSYTLPDYPVISELYGNLLPSEAQYSDVVAWLKSTGRIDTAPAYKKVMNETFVR